MTKRKEEFVILGVAGNDERKVQFYDETVQCGVPCMEGDARPELVSLGELLNLNNESQYVVEARGESMKGAYIFPGDILIFDTMKPARNGSIVLARVDGENTVKFFMKNELTGQTMLVPANPAFQPITINDTMDFRVRGTLIYKVSRYDKSAEVLGKLQVPATQMKMLKLGESEKVNEFAKYIVDQSRTEEIMSKLKFLLKGKKGVGVAMVIQCAIELNLITRPTFPDLQKAFGSIGSAASYYKAMRNQVFYGSDMIATKKHLVK